MSARFGTRLGRHVCGDSGLLDDCRMDPICVEAEWCAVERGLAALGSMLRAFGRQNEKSPEAEAPGR